MTAPDPAAEQREPEIHEPTIERVRRDVDQYKCQAAWLDTWSLLQMFDRLRAENAKLRERVDYLYGQESQWSRIAIQADCRADRIEQTARDAVRFLPQSCRYHGQDFEFLGMQNGYPRCESCRPAFYADQLRAALASDAPGAGLDPAEVQAANDDERET